jgi:hypothetical protein
MLKRASEELDKAVDALRNELFAQTMEEPQTSFKTREVYDLIRRQYFGLKEEYENTLAQKFKIQREVISPERAMFMAKNIFVHGEYKRLREEVRRYKKERKSSRQNCLPMLGKKNNSRGEIGQYSRVQYSCNNSIIC